MPITLFGATNSTWTQIVLLMLEELGLEYVLKPIDLIENELQVRGRLPQLGQAYCFAQFPGLLQSRDLSEKTPVIEIDGYMLFEARAICRFLAHKYQINPASLSLPTDTDALGAFEQAASVEYAYFEPTVAQLILVKYKSNSESSYVQHTDHT
jgi:glutathione S-transferase